MAAVGVTFLFLMALRKKLREKNFFKDISEPNLLSYLDLVALGTVCDVVSLTKCNRVFVKVGLNLIKERRNLGITKIIDNSNFRFNDMENLYYFKSNRWDVITKGGLTLKMPSNLTVKKLNLMFKIIQENDFNDNKIIDFRQSDMMVIN